MNPAPSSSDTVLRDNVPLFVYFRDASFSQTLDFINQTKELVCSVAAFSYLMIDPRVRLMVLAAIKKFQLDDYL
jgi:hypothetical protein